MTKSTRALRYKFGLDNLKTEGARTMAKFGTPLALTADNPHPRRSILPDPFVVLVVGK